MGLVRFLFSFSWLYRPCLQPSHDPLLSPTQSHISPGHTPVGPLALFISCPSLHGPQISLFHSFAISPCVHYLDLLDVRCPICRTCDVNFCLSMLCLYLLPLLLLSYQFLSSFFLLPSVSPSLIYQCFLPSFLFTLPLPFQIPQCALLAQRAIHCQYISHGWCVAPHSNIL